MHRLYFILLFCAHTALAQPLLTRRLDSFFRTQPAIAPGIAVSIEKHGEVIYRNAAGLADLSTKVPLDSLSNFRLASVTKQFTAMGILLLEKDGSLTLNDPIGRWLPELPARIGHQVLIRHLLTHSSGVLDYESLIPPTQTTQLLDADVLSLLALHDSTYFPPGSRFRYSNSGFCLLALIIERVSHQSFAAFIRERIFLPLHMNNSTVYQQGQPIAHRAMGYAKDSAGSVVPSDQSITSTTKGDGGIYTSLADYSKWIRALQQNQLIKLPATLRRLRFPIAGTDGLALTTGLAAATGLTIPPNSYYAAGWFITGTSPVILFHPGSTCGFQNFVIQIPGDEWTIVCFSNLAENSTPFRDIIKILKETGMDDFSPVWSLFDLTR